MEWSLDFCLACDKQTDGNVYCSEACRLAEYDESSSAASSPVAPRGSWSAARSNHGFYLEPAYNFTKAQPYGSTPTRTDLTSLTRSSPVSRPVLTPSSSQSSLFSMQSASSTSSNSSSSSTEPAQLSAESRQALRAYASSFDQSRRSRRQSGH